MNIRNQEDLYERVKKAFANYKKSPKDRISVSYIESRSENLEKWSQDFEKTHCELVGSVEKEKRAGIPYFSEDLYSAFDDAYIEYKTRMKDDLRQLSTNVKSSSVASTTSVEVKLPQIQLPRFSGSYEEWQSFHDLFWSLIHTNVSLSAVQKLHYLKSSLHGEAEQLLKNLSTTDSNYDEAWKQLARRYTNKRYNCNEVMKSLFGQRLVVTESATGIKQLLDTTAACLKSLQNLKIDTSSWDAIINHIVLMKMDAESRKMWELQINQTESEELPTWQQLSTFLETRFRTLEMIDGGRNNTSNKGTFKPISKQKSFHATVSEEKRKSGSNCKVCSGQHLLFQCKQFGKQSPKERYEYIQSQNLCFNCLAPTHNVRQCHQTTCCRRCGRRHHTLLHVDKVYDSNNLVNKNNESNQAQESNQSEVEKKVVTHFAKKESEVNVLLATAIAKAKSTNGYSQLFRLLIDQGSEASFITEATVQSLGLRRSLVNGLVSGVGDGQTKIKHMVQLSLESLQNPRLSVQVHAYVLSNLTSFLPSAQSNIINWPDIEDLPLADPEYGSPAKIDMILGADVHSEIIKEGLIKHPGLHGPVAQNTHFGWVLSGPVNQNFLSTPRVISLHLQVKEDQLLKLFWEIEREPDEIKKKLTKDEVMCEEFYEKTTIRDTDGRYVVRLPFERSSPECLKGKSQEIARGRFMSLEKKLMKNPSMYKEYRKAIDDYIVQNHMKEITNIEDVQKKECMYLPHHPVIREDKETTKLRIVFDASCRGVNNVSLNDNLRVGPKLQQDLRHILMRWRLHPICIVADLKQMYRQVLVHEDDTDVQRILWRSNPDMPIQHYKLLRLTFGTSCAPYLAVKTLQQLAKDEYSKYPVAAKITLEVYYIDDLLTGCENTEQAIEIYNQMTGLMGAGGFTLQKWNSNSKALLEYIREESKGSEALVFKFNDIIKVLGISWCQKIDCFEYTLQLPDLPERITKRNVLSNIARLYDPMGWIAPIIVIAKIYIQKLLKSGLNWDDRLTEDLSREWCEFRDDITKVDTIVIPRWMNTKPETKLELHVFADASQLAYAAAVYLKSEKDGHVSVNLVSAKTKVSPNGKELSIPRLELCAALLATKLIYETSQIMKIPKENLYAWSDSTVVLAWIDGEPSRWTTFVSNRVSEILTMLDKDQWSHVKTNENPADVASRGMQVSRLLDNSLWWRGPWWLKETTCQGRQTNKEFTTQEEIRAIKNFVTVKSSREEDQMFTKFSSLSKTLNILAICKRILTKEKKKFVTVQERNFVLQSCIRHSQGVYFEEEITAIKDQGYVSKKNYLHTLCPILDENGILRVGGRINHAQVEYDRRHPIIMSSESHITNLIIADAHMKTLHGVPQIMLNLLRSKYWIIRARTLVKKYYRKCTTCIRYSRPQDKNQYMGQLPKTRITPSRPFQSTGVDFTGHINLRMSPGRGSKSYKGYVCVFVCMATKAIHLEAVSDLTAKGFIAAFHRFVSRRGHCKDLYSDNATNLVGADKELRKMISDAKSQLSDELSQQLASDGTTWHFIPPHAPNFGGLWEAGVRCMKSHLIRVVGDSTLTFEELSTVLTQIEACLNSRPLSYITDNPDDPLPLTFSSENP